MSYEQHQAADCIEASQAIETLRLKLAEIEADRSARIKNGMSEADASLGAGIEALTTVSKVLEHHSIKSRSIVRVLADLCAIALEARPSTMLALRGGKGRPPENPTVEEVKGYLVAIVKHRLEQREGDETTRLEACAWVARRLSKPLRTALRDPKPKTIEGWLFQFGDDHAEPGRGRHGYVAMREKLKEMPNDSELKRWMIDLGSFFISPAEPD